MWSYGGTQAELSDLQLYCQPASPPKPVTTIAIKCSDASNHPGFRYLGVTVSDLKYG
jgi:hypothetical protein